MGCAGVWYVGGRNRNDATEAADVARIEEVKKCGKAAHGQDAHSGPESTAKEVAPAQHHTRWRVDCRQFARLLLRLRRCDRADNAVGANAPRRDRSRGSRGRRRGCGTCGPLSACGGGSFLRHCGGGSANLGARGWARSGSRGGCRWSSSTVARGALRLRALLLPARPRHAPPATRAHGVPPPLASPLPLRTRRARLRPQEAQHSRPRERRRRALRAPPPRVLSPAESAPRVQHQWELPEAQPSQAHWTGLPPLAPRPRARALDSCRGATGQTCRSCGLRPFLR